MKTTKKNYTRRKVVAGVAIFASLALIGTGFASFIISTNKPSNVDGNIEIGDVVDKTVNFYDVKLSESKIQFEPKDTDATGRVRYDNKNKEILSTTLTFYIDNSSQADSIHVYLTVPDAIRTAATDNYITLPSIATYTTNTTDITGFDIKIDGTTNNEEKIKVEDATSYNDGSKDVTLTEGKKITYQIDFGWGTAFNKMNPGEYYDTDTDGKAVSDKDMKTTLETFHALLTDDDKMTVNLSVNLN